METGSIVMDVYSFLAHSVRVYEHYALPVLALDPEDEVRIKAAAVEEAHTFAAGQITQQEELGAVRQRIRFLCAVVSQISDELELTILQARRR